MGRVSPLLPLPVAVALAQRTDAELGRSVQAEERSVPGQTDASSATVSWVRATANDETVWFMDR